MKDVTLVDWLHGGTPDLQDAVALPRLTLGESGDLAVLGVLGVGGMARVDRAHHRVMDREVAIKRTLSSTPGAVQSLIREAVLAGQLQHPNIVPVHFVGETDEGEPVVVMRAVDGVSWAEDIADRPEATADHLRVFDALCRAVAYAHSKGVIHRDLKPENVRIGAFGEVYLLDWGIACRLDGGAARPAGTPSYMPPEGVRGGPPDVRFDVHCLGACLLHVVRGSAPVRSTTEEGAVEPMTIPAGLPAGLVEILEKACAEAVDRRFPDVESLRASVARWQEDVATHRLLQAAHARRRELQTTDAMHEARERFAVARFAYEQVLEGRPDHTEAREGLWACVDDMALREARAGHADAARALLRQRHEPPDTLVEEVERHLVERATRDAERQRLEALAQHHDLNASRRALWIIGLVVAVSAVGTVGFVLTVFGPIPYDSPGIHRRLFLLILPINALVCTTAAWLWPTVRDSPAGRRLLGAVVAASAAMCFERGIVWAFDLRLNQGITAALPMELAFGLATAVGAMLFSRWFLLPAVVSGLSWPLIFSRLDGADLGLRYNLVIVTWILTVLWAWNKAVSEGDGPAAS